MNVYDGFCLLTYIVRYNTRKKKRQDKTQDEDKTRPTHDKDKIRQDKTPDKTQEKTRQHKTRQDETRQDTLRLCYHGNELSLKLLYIAFTQRDSKWVEMYHYKTITKKKTYSKTPHT